MTRRVRELLKPGSRKRRKLTVIIFQRDAEEWVAQCLECDIGAQASTLLDLLYELQRVLVGHVVISRHHGLEPFECLPPAPGDYRNRLEAREPAAISPPADFPVSDRLSRSRAWTRATSSLPECPIRSHGHRALAPSSRASGNLEQTCVKSRSQ